MPHIGPMELILVLVLALMVLGPGRLPDAGRALGTSMREFKESVTGGSKDDDKSIAASEHDEPATPEKHDDAISRPRG